MALELSSARKKAATLLGDVIGKELDALGMGRARVVVDVAPQRGGTDLDVEGARLGRDGIDRVEFLIAPNPGVEPRPLRRIASGGELSRALLALKRALADGGPAGLYVFDEVDAGVGGAVAERIGRAIADVARHRQVLCITHLASIAAFADAHFVVEKQEKAGLATTRVERVAGKDRLGELARMLAGANVEPGRAQSGRGDAARCARKPRRRRALKSRQNLALSPRLRYGKWGESLVHRCHRGSLGDRAKDSAAPAPRTAVPPASPSALSIGSPNEGRLDGGTRLPRGSVPSGGPFLRGVECSLGIAFAGQFARPRCQARRAPLS